MFIDLFNSVPGTVAERLLSWMFDLFFITTVAYPSNFSICNASCMFQMIWWHLLLSTLGAHFAFPSTGDAVAALELLHQSQVTVTIKTGVQILCSLSALLYHLNLAVGAATGCRWDHHFTCHWNQRTLEKDFLPEQISKDKMPKEECINFESQHWRCWQPHQDLTTNNLLLKTAFTIYCKTEQKCQSHAGSLTSEWSLCKQIVPHADHQSLGKLVNLSVSSNTSFHVKMATSKDCQVSIQLSSCSPFQEVTYRYLWGDETRGVLVPDYVCAVFQWVNTWLNVHKPMNKSGVILLFL